MEKYVVYYQTEIIADEPENNMVWPWQLLGTTMAISEKQAINNVKFKHFGPLNHYRPISSGGHWEKYINFKAEPVRKGGGR